MVIVAGFLGSGKTSLLNHLLRHNRGMRIGVVVNDFGSINIDSMLVAGQVDSLVSLGNGCMCCAIDVDDMDATFEALTSSDASLDAIVVEASGLAEPRNMIRLVLASSNPRIRYGGLVVVVDAIAWPVTSLANPELRKHLPLADLTVLNKVDHVSAEDLTALETEIRGVVGDVPIARTSFGAIDVDLLFDAPDRHTTAPRQLSLDDLIREIDDSRHDHLHAGYDSMSFTADDPMDPRIFVDLLENPPAGVYRTKGFVDFGTVGRHHRRYIVHTVGRHIRFEKTTGVGTELVLIGTGIDTGALRSSLDAIVIGEPANNDRMLVVHRYVAT